MAPNEIQFIGRVTSLPVVSSALGFASDSYGKIKGYNELVGSTLNKAEQSFYYVAESAKPVVQKLERQLSYADNIVCHGLDKLEEKVPAIKQSPEEIYKNGWGKYEEVRKLGTDRVLGLKDYGLVKVNSALASPYAQAVMKSVDTAMDLTENAVDHYLPAAEDEPQVEGKNEHNVVQRMGSLSEKMKRRMYRQAMNQMQFLQKRSQVALENMSHSVNLIQYAKSLEESGRQRVSDGVTAVQSQAWKLWEELKKEEEAVAQEGETLRKSVDQQLLSVARRATREVINRYNQLNGMSHLLPENVQKSLEMSTNYAKDVYSQLFAATSLKDVSDVALKQMASAVDVMQKTLSPVIPALGWFSQRETTTSSPSQ